MLQFCEDFIMVIPKYKQTDMHKHLMLHLIISLEEMTLALENQIITGKLFFINREVSHKIALPPYQSVVLLIDSTTLLAQQIREKYLINKSYYVMTDFQTNEILINLNKGIQNQNLAVKAIIDILHTLELKSAKTVLIKDLRIRELVERMNQREKLLESIPQIAEGVNLSPSRLSHLFKQEVGINLKSYMVLMRLKGVYELILSGKNSTQSAMELGFSDSAHLSATAKRLTGISIHTFLYG